MRSFNPIPILTATVAALALATAMALNVPSFDEIDADGDGFVSRTEAQVLPCLAENYDQAERSDQRGLNPSEYRRAINQFCY